MRADLTVVNARIYTMDADHPMAEALAVCGGRIVSVGDRDAVRATVGPDTEELDAQGRLLLPAFTDAHIHLVEYGQSLQRLQLDQETSIDAVVRRVAERAGKATPGTWIRGLGWNRNLWQGSPLPTRQDLDAAAPNVPVLLDSKDLHAAWVNTAGLRAAGISAQTPDPPGGVIERDARTGEPTGVLKEGPAVRLVSDHIPHASLAELQVAIDAATCNLHRLGITSVHVPEGYRELRAVMDLWHRGDLGLRILWMVAAEQLPCLVQAGLTGGFGDEWLSLGPVKAFADGALGSRTADMFDAYETEPRNHGVQVTSTESLTALVGECTMGGWNVAIHAIGDRANSRVLDALEKHWREWKTRGLRPRIEHVQLLAPQDLPRLGAMGLVASMQPIHCTSDMEMAERYWGRRCSGAYAWRSLLESGAHLTFGSDAPVEEPSVFRGLYAAVTRRRENGPPLKGWYPQQRLSVSEAVYCYTMGAAYAAGQERETGSITFGKRADLILLSEDIFSQPSEALLETQVDLTMIGGEIAYVSK